MRAYFEEERLFISIVVTCFHLGEKKRIDSSMIFDTHISSSTITSSWDGFAVRISYCFKFNHSSSSVFLRFPKLRRSLEREFGLHLHKLLLHDGIRSRILSSSPLHKLRATYIYITNCWELKYIDDKNPSLFLPYLVKRMICWYVWWTNIVIVITIIWCTDSGHCGDSVVFVVMCTCVHANSIICICWYVLCQFSLCFWLVLYS